MKIAIGNDHVAVDLKFHIVEYLKKQGHEVVNFGTDAFTSCNYPVYSEKVAKAVVSGEADKGILICGTGIGISIAANKVPGVRAALCHNTFCAQMCRQHNDAQILAMGARVLDLETALSIVETFFSYEFEGGRHTARVNKIMEIEHH